MAAGGEDALVVQLHELYAHTTLRRLKEMAIEGELDKVPTATRRALGRAVEIKCTACVAGKQRDRHQRRDERLDAETTRESERRSLGGHAEESDREENEENDGEGRHGIIPHSDNMPLPDGDDDDEYFQIENREGKNKGEDMRDREVRRVPQVGLRDEMREEEDAEEETTDTETDN